MEFAIIKNKTDNKLVQFRINTLQEICVQCNEIGIDFLVYKGVALSIQLYNDETRRQSYDIDCIVKKDQLKEFLSVLKNLGYKCKSDMSDIEPDDYESYIGYPHLVPFYKRNGYKIIILEVHLSTLANPEYIYTNIDLFENTVGLFLKSGHKIYTLSYTLNFLSLINHFVHHLVSILITYMFERKHSYKYNYHCIGELFIFYEKYILHINIEKLIGFAKESDSIENLILVNHHIQEIYRINIFSKGKLKELLKPNISLYKQLCNYLSNISLTDLVSTKEDILLEKFGSIIQYSPCKTVNLYRGQTFSEKILLSNDCYGVKKRSYPEYTISYREDNSVIFRIKFSKEYFLGKYISVIFVIQKENCHKLSWIYYDIFPDCTEKDRRNTENVFKIMKTKISGDCYEIDMIMEDVTIKLFRFNLVIRNVTRHESILDHVSICNTLDIFDITKYAELRLYNSCMPSLSSDRYNSFPTREKTCSKNLKNAVSGCADCANQPAGTILR
jgi:hypothetical protein